ncbi:MAG: sterol homeostasis protein [Vezdaea aestivalis]|nr:MAG: sterol homeostasis protein [Vezdaea aestivalis]
MKICVECAYPCQTLYTSYKIADDKALGRGVRLTNCQRCRRFADPYQSYDQTLIFINLVLMKPQVYRHLLFNRLGRDDDTFDPSIIRLAVLLLLFDVYLTWARIERLSSPPPNILSEQPIVLQYLFFLFLCLTESLLFHLIIRLLARLLVGNTRPNGVSTALFVSSCTKLFPILMVIWEYDIPAAAKSVGWAVVVNNVEALRILLDCGYLTAGLLTAVGSLVRIAAGWVILSAVGLAEASGYSALQLGKGDLKVVSEWGWRMGLG